MSFTTPIFIPLTSGLDLSKDSALGEHDLTLAENVDFAVAGQVRGRPGRAASQQFIVRDPSGTSTYFAAQSLAASGFRANGLMRLKDGTDERPMLGTDGRLFVLEGTEWKDRGAFASMRADQPHLFTPQPSTGLVRVVTGPDFGHYTAVAGNEATVSLLNPTTLGYERRASTSIASGYEAGTMARCGTVTATVYRLSTNALRIALRSNGATTISDVLIASDAKATVGDGDAPCICCDFDQTAFFVVYQTTTADTYKVMRVTTSGVVSATYTDTIVGLHGHWVSNSSVAGNFVAVAITHPDGLTTRTLNATAMTNNTTGSTHGTVACAAKECVIGVESTTRVWWAYRQSLATVAGLRVGYANPGTAATAVLAKTYSSVASDGSALGVRYYTPMHQPLLFGGRVYLSIAEYTESVADPSVGTWFTLDLSNLKVGTAVGCFDQPTLVARGRTDGYAGKLTSKQPESAVLRSDSTGWTFVSIDWTTYATSQSGSVAGQASQTVLNRIALTGPRCVVAGEATLFSGGVPRSLAGDQCFEAGFPSLRPSLQLNPTNVGGLLAAGSYSIYVCWMYVDGGGQVHRSAVTGLEQAVTGGASFIDVYVQTPYFTERPAGEVRLEVYSTNTTPASGDPAFLQAVVVPSTTAGSTRYQFGLSSSVVLSTQGLYTLDGAFSHVTPAADGGIAALGRRIWVADRNTVYASLLLNPREGVAWNDEGSLSVALPAGAGRIMALEGMDDKLVVFCERGVWAIQDGGPNNVGVGSDISFPVKLTELGCAGPRSTCVTDRGVLFCSPLDSADPQRGGPWLLDRSLSLTDRKFLGTPALTYFTGNGSWAPEAAFSPERQQAYITVPSADTEGNAGVVVIDFRQSKWSTWSVYEALAGEMRFIDVIGGCLWDVCTEPAGFTAAPGAGSVGDNVYLRVRTTHLFSDGRNGLGWARVRGVSVLGSEGGSGYNMTIYATQDQTFSTNSLSITVPTPAADTTWPTTRTAPEWRLPRQKCASIQIMLQTAVHTARWAAIRLEVQPLPSRAPARNRS